MATEPCDLPATAARALIGRRALSPVELLESCLARVAAINPAVNAVVAMDPDAARATARAAEAAVMSGDPLPPLHGLPLGIKDLEDTAGLRTTYGSPIFRDHVPAADEGMVAAVRAAGAVILGKTNTPEFGAGANTRNVVYGATGNPFDPARSAAGSSGGSAVALATGMVPLATGSDVGGSLRNPAAFCGVVGFRPSPGLVPGTRRQHGWSHFSTLGPMARSVPDLCLLLGAMATHDPRDPLSGRTPPDLARPPPLDLATLRVAATEDFGFAPTERGVRATFRHRLDALRPLFARVDEASPDCAGADESFAVLRAAAFLSAHADKVRTRPNEVGPNVHANVAEGERYTLADGARAATAQTAMYRRWVAFFDDHDVIVTPSITISPRPWTELAPTEIDGIPIRSYYQWLGLAYAVTLVGFPAVSLPLGLDAAGLPFGLQIVGPRGGDARVLGVAAALEAALAGDPVLCRPSPDLDALRRAPAMATRPGFLATS